MACSGLFPTPAMLSAKGVGLPSNQWILMDSECKFNQLNLHKCVH